MMENIIEKIRGFTMVTQKRLENLINLSNRVIEDTIPGDFVECGTCRGGSAALLAYIAKEEGWKRNVWLFDSFQGHPVPMDNTAPDRAIMHEWAGTMIASEADVKLALRTLDVYVEQQVKIIPGWFQETLPIAGINEIALVHIDCDWYESILCCLTHLYPKVMSGGYIIVDDYSYSDTPGVKIAVDQFFAQRENVIAETFFVNPAKIFKIK
ncbi:MAG: TylF/MycF family methyltransferase [Candidatus Omnitrophica bacterium]|nr:TylF/MycF family methyltransferase [Candidatus Omnitrophota bacterium]